MDLLSEIRQKLPALEGHEAAEGIRAAVRHIEVAERWLARGRYERDDDLFNDVVYRTNQAFEGILKEAFSVLTGNSTKKLATHQIEQRLLDSNALTGRVHQLFTNYRQQWRNESTHDHRLLFKEQEALLAIVSVSAFAAILLDQVVEAVSFQREQHDLSHRRDWLRLHVIVNGEAPLHEQVMSLLTAFGMDPQSSGSIGDRTSEAELLGRIAAFIESVQPGLKVERDVRLDGPRSNRPDLLVTLEREKVVVEIKRVTTERYTPRSLQHGLYQMLGFLETAGTSDGVLFLVPELPAPILRTTSHEFTLGARKVTAHVVGPEWTVSESARFRDDPYGF